jgi:GST-like protein
VPVLTNYDGPGGKPYTLLEFGAIRPHLAEKTGKALPTDAGRKFGAIRWMMAQMTGSTATARPALGCALMPSVA